MAVAAIRAAQRKRRQREAADARRAAEEGRSEAPPKAPEAPAKPVEDASPPTGVWKYQPLVRAVYTNARTQLFVAALIVLNFLCNVLEKQVDPQATHSVPDVRSLVGLFFTSVKCIHRLSGRQRRGGLLSTPSTPSFWSSFSSTCTPTGSGASGPRRGTYLTL